jgi:hypothetical protein
MFDRMLLPGDWSAAYFRGKKHTSSPDFCFPLGVSLALAIIGRDILKMHECATPDITHGS